MSQVAAIDVTRRYQSVASIKANGETYTPKALSDFVARHICSGFDFSSASTIRILDPSIGDGALSISLLDEVRKIHKGDIELFAFDTNTEAMAIARERVENYHPDCTLHFKNMDFLEFVLDGDREPDLLSLGNKQERPSFDLIIANPPYVRTQIMGADEAQRLAFAFGLTGRVDLYQAFLLAMAKVLAPNGSAGFIVSNRFMTTKGGGSLREKLREMLVLREVWDLGDTKLFDAAVLPAVIVANGLRGKESGNATVAFTSIYETQEQTDLRAASPISALSMEGIIAVDDGRRFLVKSGTLDSSGGADAVWRVATATGDAWMATVQRHTERTFGQIGKIRVGVKTCADKIFIRHDWEVTTNGRIPELLRPLTTHHGAGRYRATIPKKVRHILYPHAVIDGQRRASDLDQFPNSLEYLEANRVALEQRTYVIEGGRKWYEIWVPQDPASWSCPKLVFRDISERPTFWIDLDGSVVNGDCYWMIAANENETELLWLAVAVANSTFIEAFYDHCFNNKLYAGRRRFITQYVEQFPLPDPKSSLAQTIINKAKLIYQASHSLAVEGMERELDALVWEAFGLGEEFSG
jgi:adenine-specific DNA-methyltransferase